MNKIAKLDLRIVTLEKFARREIFGRVFIQPDIFPKNDNRSPRETSYATRIGILGHMTRLPFFLKHNL